MNRLIMPTLLTLTNFAAYAEINSDTFTKTETYSNAFSKAETCEVYAMMAEKAMLLRQQHKGNANDWAQFVRDIDSDVINKTLGKFLVRMMWAASEFGVEQSELGKYATIREFKMAIFNDCMAKPDKMGLYDAAERREAHR